MTVELLSDIAAWMRGDVPEWAKAVWKTAALNLRVAPGALAGQPFERHGRYPGMRLLVATDEGHGVGYLLYEHLDGGIEVQLHYVARDPARYGARIADLLFNNILGRVHEPLICAWPETDEGQVAMVRWGFREVGYKDWEYRRE